MAEDQLYQSLEWERPAPHQKLAKQKAPDGQPLFEVFNSEGNNARYKWSVIDRSMGTAITTEGYYNATAGTKYCEARWQDIQYRTDPKKRCNRPGCSEPADWKLVEDRLLGTRTTVQTCTVDIGWAFARMLGKSFHAEEVRRDEP